MALDQRWGDESPTLTKRYVARLDRVASGKTTPRGGSGLVAAKLAGMVLAPPAAVVGTGVAVAEVAHTLLPSLSPQISATLGQGSLLGMIGIDCFGATAAVVVLWGDPSIETARRRFDSMLRVTRTPSVVATVVTAVSALALDTGDAVGALHATGLAHTANTVFGGAAATAGLLTAGRKLDRAIAKPVPGRDTARKGLGE